MPKSLEERTKRDREHEEIIKKAVTFADHIILEGSNGSIEETDYLTAMVARAFNEKVYQAIQYRLLMQDLLDK